MDDPSIPPFSPHYQCFAFGISSELSPHQEKQNCSCSPSPISDPVGSIHSHEQIFKQLPSVLLLIASVKKHYFPNSIRRRGGYVFLKATVLVDNAWISHPLIKGKLLLPHIEAFVAVMLLKG